jgi:hypothetical protein
VVFQFGLRELCLFFFAHFAVKVFIFSPGGFKAFNRKERKELRAKFAKKQIETLLLSQGPALRLECKSSLLPGSYSLIKGALKILRLCSALSLLHGIESLQVRKERSHLEWNLLSGRCQG